MDTITDRIKELMNALGLNTTSFAKEIGVSWTSVNNYTKGRVPDGRTLISIQQKFGVNINWLLSGKGKMLLSNNHTVNEPGAFYTPKVITVDSTGSENVLMVPHYAQAGYLDGYSDPEFLENLPSFRLPKLNNGTFRMFEVRGHSMIPTLHDGSIAVGEWVEDFASIQDDQIYILVTKDDGIVIKRVLNRINKYGNLYLKSDNRAEFPSYTVQPVDVVEIWKLKTAFLFNFSNPADMYDRVNDLEAEMAQIRLLLSK